MSSIEIQVDLTGGIKDYAMFTDLGNAAVHAIVMAAQAKGLTWRQVYGALRELSANEQFGEATDTAVRECVYDALGFEDEPFYI